MRDQLVFIMDDRRGEKFPLDELNTPLVRGFGDFSNILFPEHQVVTRAKPFSAPTCSSPLYRLLVLLGLVGLTALTITFLIYSHDIFKSLGPIAEAWRQAPGGWIIIWLVVFASAFPPLIGYSTANTVAGFIFGFPLGWPIVASATTIGSLAAFMASRTILSAYVHRLVGKDHRFLALGQVLKKEGVGMLTMIRFCPLPFSLSNGFLATIPSITPLMFTLSTAFASPKLLVHIFIGSRIALLVEDGGKMTAGTKAINYLSMFLGGSIGVTVGWLIYRRTMARAAELALEAATEEGLASSPSSPRVGGNGSGLGYADYVGSDEFSRATLLDPGDAAAVLADDDDISLWDNTDRVGSYSDGDGFGKANNRW
ncbi:unnamed protein product [Parascedosporium putredinis]|uniref:Golgi apparatus membrane protein TVP38 n=1 Tax=Parascedosporium putredinis TaxID=1442378 RepID=A0A9P1H5S6_9PEZI|nr:unnamed protein product [Parascedosporium putredinis]CAI7998211.1 unnamed protein product [Parascedosporium putredinis]